MYDFGLQEYKAKKGSIYEHDRSYLQTIVVAGVDRKVLLELVMAGFFLSSIHIFGFVITPMVPASSPIRTKLRFADFSL